MTPSAGLATLAPSLREDHLERLLGSLRLDLRLVLDLAVIDLDTGLIQATLGSDGGVHHDLCRAVDRCLETVVGLEAFAGVWNQVSGEAKEPCGEVVLADSDSLLIHLRGRQGLGIVALVDSRTPLGLVLARLHETQRALDALAREGGP